MPKLIDLSARKFGRWTVIGRAPKVKYWLCRCECGREVAVTGQSLREGRSVQCQVCGHAAAVAKNAARPLEKRFWKNIEPEPNSGCWLWVGACDKRRYGQLRLADGLHYATHIAFTLYKGGLPPGLHALHRCDNPPCVNPDHLFAGTHQDNMADALSKGRMNIAGLAMGWGISRPNITTRKLTNNQINEIRASPLGYKSLSKKYNVSYSAVRKVRQGKTYKDV